jgi:hypothetical protein
MAIMKPVEGSTLEGVKKTVEELREAGVDAVSVSAQPNPKKPPEFRIATGQEATLARQLDGLDFEPQDIIDALDKAALKKDFEASKR